MTHSYVCRSSFICASDVFRTLSATPIHQLTTNSQTDSGIVVESETKRARTHKGEGRRERGRKRKREGERERKRERERERERGGERGREGRECTRYSTCGVCVCVCD